MLSEAASPSPARRIGRARRACRSPRARFPPSERAPACGADKDSSERPSIDGDSRPGGETMLTPSTDSIDASSPAESSLDASRVTTRRCREDAGASASSTALSGPEAAGRAALAAASPVGAAAPARRRRRGGRPLQHAAQWCCGCPRRQLATKSKRCQQHSGAARIHCRSAVRYRYQVKGNDPFVAWCCNDDPLAPRAFAYSHFLQAGDVADKRVSLWRWMLRVRHHLGAQAVRMAQLA